MKFIPPNRDNNIVEIKSKIREGTAAIANTNGMDNRVNELAINETEWMGVK